MAGSHAGSFPHNRSPRTKTSPAQARHSLRPWPGGTHCLGCPSEGPDPELLLMTQLQPWMGGPPTDPRMVIAGRSLPGTSTHALAELGKSPVPLHHPSSGNELELGRDTVDVLDIIDVSTGPNLQGEQERHVDLLGVGGKRNQNGSQLRRRRRKIRRRKRKRRRSSIIDQTECSGAGELARTSHTSLHSEEMCLFTCSGAGRGWIA